MPLQAQWFGGSVSTWEHASAHLSVSLADNAREQRAQNCRLYFPIACGKLLSLIACFEWLRTALSGKKIILDTRSADACGLVLNSQREPMKLVFLCEWYAAAMPIYNNKHNRWQKQILLYRSIVICAREVCGWHTLCCNRQTNTHRLLKMFSTRDVR